MIGLTIFQKALVSESIKDSFVNSVRQLLQEKSNLGSKGSCIETFLDYLEEGFLVKEGLVVVITKLWAGVRHNEA